MTPFRGNDAVPSQPFRYPALQARLKRAAKRLSYIVPSAGGASTAMSNFLSEKHNMC
jgi:hypothetical protein